MDVVVKGRHTVVQEQFRNHVSAKLEKIEKLDPSALRVDVEISEEHNPRQSGRKERVELTVRSRGPVIRAGAAAYDRYVALDRAVAKLGERLRRMADRRKSARHGLIAAGQARNSRAVPGARSARMKGRLARGARGYAG